jgi:trans-aconitate methyltransferase
MTLRHSFKILNHLREYDTFLESLKTICDMGCGTGEDITWWATLESRDDPPEPYNYTCYAVDRDQRKLDKVPDLANIHKINRDISDEVITPVKVDLMWSHDSLQYSINPLATLKTWNEHMNVNAMLVLTVPQSNGIEYNRYYSRTHSGCYYNHTPTSLIYMLAVNGFDCRDAYLYKQAQDPWIQIAVYKSEVAPMDPATTTWYDLVESGLLHPSMEQSINANGFLKQEDIVMPWLDKENYYIDWVPQWTEIPSAAGAPIVDGVFNETKKSETSTAKQGKKVKKETKLLDRIQLPRPPKRSFTK